MLVQQFGTPGYSDTRMLAEVEQANIAYQREVLKYITDIGSSLRLHMDIETLVQRVSEASCKALGFRHSALYLADGNGLFRVCAVTGLNQEYETYLLQHPLPEDIVAELIVEAYRISESYFIPAEAPLWRNEHINSFFIVDESDYAHLSREAFPVYEALDPSISLPWHPEDMLVVPLVKADNTLLGFLTPDSPLDGRRPTRETMALLELFANQAAVVIEGASLYKEAQQTSEERAALIKIGRALSAPTAMRDLQTVYSTIHEQVGRVMPTDAFYISRYASATETLLLDFIIDEGVMYPAQEYTHYPQSLKKILYQENAGLLFETSEEFSAFLQEENPNTSEGRIGNDRPSQSLLFASIRYGGQVLGLLSAQCYRPNAYTKRHLEMLKEISIQAGIAITNTRLNTELREAMKRAQESEQLKDHFLMTASHELRTPLTAIQGYLELLENFSTVLDEAAKKRFLDNARRACEELVLLLGNVMDTSRIDAESVSLNLESVRVVNAVQLILEILEPTIAREERTVTVTIPEEMAVLVDELRLRQVLLNIVGNALKYTPITSDIAITATSIEGVALNSRLLAWQQEPFPSTSTPRNGEAEFVVIAIRDWGPGIGAEDRQRLFTKFMRLVSAINSPQRGAGLGLFLCRQLIEAMGGRIWVESAGIPGEGSTFAMALPYAPHE